MTLLKYLKNKIDGYSLNEKKLIVNEEIQKIVLIGINNSGITKLYFLGGTNLRLCYNLDRYSEDLDFSFHGKNLNLDLLSKSINLLFKNIGINSELKWNKNTNVYKTFFKVPNIYYDLGLSGVKSENISVKIEIDTNPPEYYKFGTKILNGFLGKFSISNYDISTTFSGKICAVLLRNYSKGRDYYDLLWYFQNIKSKFNLDFLNDCIRQYNLVNENKIKILYDHKDVCNILLEKIENLEMNSIKDDIKRFTNFNHKYLDDYLNNYKQEIYFYIEKYIKDINLPLNLFRL